MTMTAPLTQLQPPQPLNPVRRIGSSASTVPNPMPLGIHNSQSMPLTAPTSGTRRKLSRTDLLRVFTQMSIMVRSGVDLAEAVRSIAVRSSRPAVRDAMAQVHHALISGRRLSQALADQSHTFGGMVVAFVAAGEASGQLSEVLTRLCALLRDEVRLHSTVKSIISYPLVLLIVTLLVLAAMIFFVLPQFAGIYASSRAPTPFLTQCLLAGATAVRSYWWAVLGVLAVGGWAALHFIRSPSGRRELDRLVFRLPKIRIIAQSLLAGRMFRLQGSMLDSGVPMLEVLQLTRSAVGNSCYTALTDEIQLSVINGKGLAAVLYNRPMIPDGAAEMIGTAEANGQLGSVLQTVGEFYEAEGEQALRDAVKIAEPAIIVGLGLVVGVIVLAVMLPLLDLSTAGAV